MNRFELYKEFYFKEEEKKNEINNSLSLPIGIITGMIGGGFYFWTTYDYNGFNLALGFFALLNCGSLIYLGISIFHLIKSYSNFREGYGYSYLAGIEDLEVYFSELKKYYKNNHIPNETEDSEYEEFLITKLVKATDINQKNNRQKSFHRHYCQRNLIFALLIFAITLIPYSYNYYNKTKQNPIKIEICNPSFKVIPIENIKFDKIIKNDTVSYRPQTNRPR